MYRIKILTIGKTKEHWLKEAVEEYVSRLRGRIAIEWAIARDDIQLERWCAEESGPVFLDEQGISFNSEEFSNFLFQNLEKYGARTCFVIGGAEGLPQNMKGRKPCLSLSRLTFTHQIARLVLMEQLYRASEIAKGSPYHK